MKIKALPLVAIAIILALGLKGRSEVIFQDNFAGTLNPAWQVQHPDVAYYSVSTNGLLLRCNAGDNWQSRTDYKNLFLITNPAPQEFVFTAKARWTTLPAVNWAQFALVAYDDDDNYVRVDHQYGNGNQHIEFLVEVAGQQLPEMGWAIQEFGTNEFWLQMRQKGTNYSSWYSTDGVVFAQINSALSYTNRHPAKLGLIAMVDPTEKASLIIDSVTIEAPLSGALAIATSADKATLQLTGTVGANYRIEFSPELPAVNWVVLTNLQLPAFPCPIGDRNSITNHEKGFYRAVLVQ